MPQNDEEITRETWSDDCQSTADVIRLERHSRPFQRFVSLCRTPFYSVFIHFFFSVVSVPKRNQHEKNGISNVHRKKKNQRWKRVPFQMEIGSMRCSFFFFLEKIPVFNALTSRGLSRTDVLFLFSSGFVLVFFLFPVTAKVFLFRQLEAALPTRNAGNVDLFLLADTVWLRRTETGKEKDKKRKDPILCSCFSLEISSNNNNNRTISRSHHSKVR